jgi:hypothetical protein
VLAKPSCEIFNWVCKEAYYNFCQATRIIRKCRLFLAKLASNARISISYRTVRRRAVYWSLLGSTKLWKLRLDASREICALCYAGWSKALFFRRVREAMYRTAIVAEAFSRSRVKTIRRAAWYIWRLKLKAALCMKKVDAVSSRRVSNVLALCLSLWKELTHRLLYQRLSTLGRCVLLWRDKVCIILYSFVS